MYYIVETVDGKQYLDKCPYFSKEEAIEEIDRKKYFNHMYGNGSEMYHIIYVPNCNTI